MSNIKVLFLTPYSTEGPSNRYRVEQYLPYLEKAGIKYRIHPFMDSKFYKLLYTPKKQVRKVIYFFQSTVKRLITVWQARNYDIIFIHLEAFPFGPPFLEWLLAKVMRKPIIFDFEDAIYLNRKGRWSWLINFVKRPWKFYSIIRMSSHVIVCNQHMKELVSRYNQNVTIIPTSIDTDKFIIKRPIGVNRKLTLGWIGTPSTLPYILSIEKPLRTLSEKYDIALKIVGGGRQITIPGLEVINEKWTLENDIQSFQSLDIGLYPLPQDERAMAKTPFKTIQYMAVGVPVVASKAGSIGNIIQDGINGFLAISEEEWIRKLSLLIENPNLRERIGMTGRETTEKRFSLEVDAPKFLGVLEEVYKRK